MIDIPNPEINNLTDAEEPSLVPALGMLTDPEALFSSYLPQGSFMMSPLCPRRSLCSETLNAFHRTRELEPGSARV